MLFYLSLHTAVPRSEPRSTAKVASPELKPVYVPRVQFSIIMTGLLTFSSMTGPGSWTSMRLRTVLLGSCLSSQNDLWNPTLRRRICSRPAYEATPAMGRITLVIKATILTMMSAAIR